ncbi:MAG: 50S ribosomal protein L32 [Acidobacteria bacterium]|nr:MAG: 50S ribosomal protein L32 [Acidobacteriota bacterium]PIE91008.1 MAG: 50S ribosomal protein L32 [Acidobacteriota bacterium]
MANPKRRTSKRRRDQRRSHHALPVTHSIECPNCGAPRRPHRVCDDCGWYGDKQVAEARDE